MDQTILIITHCPDQVCAHTLAQDLVTHHLAACVNIGSSVTSIFLWQDKLEQTQEIPLFIKTQKQYYAKIEAWLDKHHPYEVPEIIALPITDGLPAYLRWIKDSVLYNQTSSV